MKFVSLYFVILSFVFIEGKDVSKYSFQADPIGNDEDTSQLHRDLSLNAPNSSCTGDGKDHCLYAGEGENGTALIGDNSCRNGQYICRFAGYNGTAQIGNYSCRDGKSACHAAGTYGKAEIGDNSCRNGFGACEALGNTGTAQIGNYSCRDGESACYTAGYEGKAEIGDNSCCNGDGACYGAGYNGTAQIGDNSCREKDDVNSGNSACLYAGKGGSAVIGDNSCLGESACDGIIATVGNKSCQCNGCCSCLKSEEVVPNNSCNELDNGEVNGEQCCTIDGDVGRKFPIKADVGGDPHFLTFSGKSFDYHGECDLLLVSIPSFASGSGLCIHIRTTRMEGRLLSYSYISGVAIRIGENIFEVQEDGTIILNGKRYAPPHVGDNKSDYPSFPIMFENYPLMKNMIGKRKRISQYILDLTNTVIDSVQDIPKELKSTGYSKAITVHANPRTRMLYVKIDGDFPDSYGLLGASNAGDRLLGRDGVTDLSHNLNEYGEEWQVIDTEPMLFSDRRAPQFPDSCLHYSSEGGHVKITHNLRRRLLADAGNMIGLVTKEDANAACAEYVGIKKQNCISDVLVMQDIEVADDPSYDK